MAKITLADGMTIEGTVEELRELAEVFGEVAEAAEKEVPEFKVGDYAKITGAGDKPPYNSHNFPIGSIVKVDEVGDNEYGDRFLGKRIDGVGYGEWVLNEYAVKATVEEVADALGEDAEETAPEPAEEVTEATEAPREGDYVVFDISTLDITEGKPYKITGIVGEELFKFEDDAGDERQGSVGNVVKGSYKLYHPIEGDPQVGDKILVVDAHLTNGKYDNGDILTVEDFYYRDIIGRYVTEVGEDKPYLQREEFVIIERAERKPALEVGDKVRLISGGGEPARFGLKDGDICEVTTTNHEGYYPIGINNGSVTGFAFPEQLEKVSDTAEEDVEEIIEEGDVVRVTGETYYGDFEEGTIAIVSYFDEHKTSGLARVVIETEDDIDRTSAENLELVAKRADRKDLAE